MYDVYIKMFMEMELLEGETLQGCGGCGYPWIYPRVEDMPWMHPQMCDISV